MGGAVGGRDEQAELERAVGRVLIAVNLDPASLKLPRGFTARAAARGGAATYAFNGLARQLVVLDHLGETDPDRIGAAALACLGAPARAACEQLVAAWKDDTGATRAAAYAVQERGDPRLLASSWTEPHTWPEPAIDALAPEEDTLRAALARVRTAVDSGPATALDDATRLVDIVLRRRDGEGQDASDRPAPRAPHGLWSAWLSRYERSVWSEWRRVGGPGDEDDGEDAGEAVAPAPAGGPLAGLRVFVSYARPDATRLAWPVRDALAALGADVWFDQEEDLRPERLDAGLGADIAGCDAYVMCASNEFVERAGYATQEVAWALQPAGPAARTERFVVVAAPDTVLPTVVAGWPCVVLGRTPARELESRLAAALTAPVASIPRPEPPRARGAAPADPIGLPAEADLAMLRRRRAHSRRFDSIDQETFAELAATSAGSRRAAALRERLIEPGAGLDWAGTLADADSWPDDTCVRDLRWRLASMRAVAGTRWPLNGDLGSPTDVAGDVEVLACRPVPLLDWPACAGWGANERRLALRFHAGTLRLLQELLRRGLDSGLPSLRQRTFDRWIAALQDRRRECADGLVALRLEGRLTWSAEPPTWDGLLRAWSAALVRPGGWSEPVATEGLLLVGGNAHDIAAVGAQAAWCAARGRGLARQSFALHPPSACVRADVYAVGPAGAAPEAPAPDARVLQVGAGPGPRLRLCWAGAAASRALDGAPAQAVPPGI